MTTGTFPRQPRASEPANQARVVTHPAYFGVECIQTDSTWFEVTQFDGGAAARAMRDQLNSLFAHSGADLDFIHITRFGSGAYAVVWPTVKWVQDGSVTTDIGGALHRRRRRLHDAGGSVSPFAALHDRRGDGLRCEALP